MDLHLRGGLLLASGVCFNEQGKYTEALRRALGASLLRDGWWSDVVMVGDG